MSVPVTIRVGATPGQIYAAVTGLALISLAQMQEGNPPPPLYESGARYQREPMGRERWQTARETARRKLGDCEDLAAYRVAELWRRGIKARVHVKVVRPGLMHIQVLLPNGKIEDPSQRLGMKGPG